VSKIHESTHCKSVHRNDEKVDEMRRLMVNLTNEELLDKIEYEGPEYFFLEYVDPDSIKDEYLRSNVRTLRMVWGEILAEIDELEGDCSDED
jgi:hypothetical protein